MGFEVLLKKTITNPANIATINAVEISRTRKFIVFRLACRASVGSITSPFVGEYFGLSTGDLHSMRLENAGRE